MYNKNACKTITNNNNNNINILKKKNFILRLQTGFSDKMIYHISLFLNDDIYTFYSFFPNIKF